MRHHVLNIIRKYTSVIIPIISVVLCFWSFLYPAPYKLVILSLIIYPLVTILFYSYSDGRFKSSNIAFDQPEVYIPFILPVCGLTLRAIIDINLINLDNGITPFIWLTLALITIYLLSAKKDLLVLNKQNAIILMYSFFVICSFSYSTLATTNAIFDHSNFNSSKSIAISKTISHQRKGGTFYRVKLNHSNPEINNKEVTINKRLYDQIQTGDTISIMLGNGLFNVPWFFIAE